MGGVRESRAVALSGHPAENGRAVWLVVGLVGSSYLHLARAHGILGTVQRRTTTQTRNPDNLWNPDEPDHATLACARQTTRGTAGLPACNLHREMSAPAHSGSHTQR